MRTSLRGKESWKERCVGKREKGVEGKRWGEMRTDWKKSKLQERRGWKRKRMRWGGAKWKGAGKWRKKKGEIEKKGGKKDGWEREEELEPRHNSGSSSWPEMLIQRFNKSMPLEKYNVSPHWVDVRGLRKCILKYFTLRGNNVLIYNSSPYTLGLSICVSDLTS